jgi:protein CpxP
MKRRIVIGISIAAIALIGAVVVSAAVYARHHGGLGGHRGFMGHIARELNLTDAQQTQIKSIIEAEKQKAEPLLAQVKSNRQQLRDATTGGKFDEAQVRQIAAQQAQTMAELIVTKERVKARIYNEVLTPEQRTKADQLLQQMHDRMKDHEGRMEHGGELGL